MKFFLYTFLLLAVLIASVLVLRSIDGEPEPVRRPAGSESVVESAPPAESGAGLERYHDLPPEELYEVATELLGTWRAREATQLFERVVAKDSSFCPAWVKLVECFSHPLVGREDDALTALERARSTCNGAADTLFLAGLERLFLIRDFIAAASVLERAHEVQDGYDDKGYYLALALMLSGQTQEALRALDDLDGSVGQAARVAELRVRCSLAAGDLDAATDQARELARVYAKQPYPYVVLSLVEQMAGRAESAVQFSNNALVLDPKYVPAIMARGNLYASHGRFEAARVSFEKLLMFDDPLLHALGHEGIGFVDLLSGRFTGAVDALDSSIRAAMLAGAVRRGLSIAVQLVGYLCELGRSDAAADVVDRWVSGFGEIPVELANLRINIVEGDLEAAGRVLQQIQSSKDWSEWARMLSIDVAEITALIHVGAEEYEAALRVLAESPPTLAAQRGSRKFLVGYASFDIGRAEKAAEAFWEVEQLLFSTEFPFHGDPVQYVRSLFYLGETSIARGNEADAAAYYERFLHYWGDAGWDVQAVARARERLEGLPPSTPQ